ncbi:MAG: lysophospholipid acyltransferase family protein [Thermoanaerobaculia bacterium]|nr:lysophospholipid acyltransferase family protein [Thermoanaerobaculia bacterium]
MSGAARPSRPRDELPTYSPRLMAWFARWLEGYFAKSFTAVRVSKTSAPPPAWDVPVILYSNHPSWWDPILFMLLGAKLVHVEEGYGPIDAAMLEKYSLFKRLGLFGVEQDSRRGAAKFLRTSLEILERPGASLWLTAEGEFTDPRRRPVALRPGIAHLAARLPRGRIVPLAMEYPFWNERRPEALVRLGPPIEIEPGEGRTVEEWTTTLEEALAATMDILAEEAQTRDPGRFETLVAGKKGVGGVYDLGRRLRALIRGERFRAGHGEEE